MKQQTKWRLPLALALAGGTMLAAAAQQKPPHQGHPQAPYAGQEKRAIKALAQGEIEGYEKGRGLGLARAAELNHYPGPMHVLEFSKELKLTKEQAAETKAARLEMLAQAVPLGKAIIAKEAELDRLFASGKADAARVTALSVEIGRLQGELRAVHLNAHVKMRKTLTPAQIATYDRLRGYDQQRVSASHR